MKEKHEVYAVMVLGKSNPQVTYTDYEQAETEAIRLCKKERLSTYVLKVVTCVSLNEVTIHKYN